MLANLLLMIWSAKAQPFKARFDNTMELNTEMFLALITFHLVCFTVFIPESNLEARLMMGTSFILSVCGLIVVNSYFVVIEMLKSFKYNAIKKYR